AKDGTVRDLDLSAFVVRNETGDPICFVGTKRDVTDRKRYEERLRLLATASAQLSASLDAHTTLEALVRLSVPVLADWCVVHLWGRGPEDHPLRAHYHPDPQLDRTLAETLTERPVVNSGQVAEAILRLDDGTSRSDEILSGEDTALLRLLGARSCV